MGQFNYNEWIKDKTDELINMQSKIKECYDKELIQEYLIFMQSNKEGYKLKEFFCNNNQDEKLLKVVLDILLDESEEYSNDARYSAANVMSMFDVDLLKKYKKELIQAQNSNIYNLRPYDLNQIPDWFL